MLDRRHKSLDHVLLSQEIEYLQPIHLHTPDKGYLTDMATVFDNFRRYKSYSFFPVINGSEPPVGLIKEIEIKEYVYSKYGKDLLLNKAAGRQTPRLCRQMSRGGRQHKDREHT